MFYTFISMFFISWFVSICTPSDHFSQLSCRATSPESAVGTSDAIDKDSYMQAVNLRFFCKTLPVLRPTAMTGL